MIGQILASYRVVRQIGQGGMGVVYLAEHAALGRAAVVKLLLPHVSKDREVVERFFNEARAATVVGHPGIVDVFDFGYAPDGAAFFVMELLQGESLADRLRKEPRLPPELARWIAQQTAAALGAAHAKGIVHRDLKPDNLFLVPDPLLAHGVRVKVLDFGIAKLTGEDLAGAVQTVTGSVMGTPLYMSPEQCRGAKTLDARSDIYSLGCILFEMLSGRRPFTGEALGAILGQHQFVEAPRLADVAPTIEPDLGDLVADMLAKDPDARPPTMAVVESRLRDPPVSSVPRMRAATAVPSWRASAQPRGRAWLVAAIAGIVATLAAGIFFLTRHHGTSEDATASLPEPLAGYEAKCEQHVPAACDSLGYAYAAGKGVAANAELAFRAFERACAAQDAEGCTVVGTMYGRGSGVAQDDRKAVQYLGVGCDGSIADACTLLALHHEQGLGVVQNQGIAAALRKKACDMGDADACSKLGTSYLTGSAGAKDEDKGAHLLEVACQASNVEACLALAELYRKGSGGVSADPAKARGFTISACRLGDRGACSRLQ